MHGYDFVKVEDQNMDLEEQEMFLSCELDQGVISLVIVAL